MKFSTTVSGFMSSSSFAMEISQKCVLKEHEDIDKITLSAEKNKIIISAFNGRLGIDTDASNLSFPDLQYEFTEEGSVTINSKDLANILGSFDGDEKILFEVVKNNNVEELVISREVDKEQFQTLPVYPDKIKAPEKASTFIQEITMGRKILIDAIEKIQFAFGYETNRPRYLRWQMKATNDKIRFISGTGSLFACLDKIGHKIKKSSKEIELFIPVEHTPVLLKILSLIDDENITIKESDPKDKKAIHQIIIQTSSGEIVLIGMNEGLAWIDESAFFNAKYTHKFITKVSDWDGVVKGILATFNNEFKQTGKIHTATFEADIAKKTVIVKTAEHLKSTRKVPYMDCECDGNKDKPKFVCPSTYMATISENAPSKDGYVQIEFIDGDKKPVIITHYASTKVEDRDNIKKSDDTTKISESFIVFFATLSV
jgi:hypothetical protein